MKKLCFLLMVLLLLVLASCSQSSRGEYSEAADSNPYEEYKTIELDDHIYRVFTPVVKTQGFNYVYYDLGLTSEKSEWVVNAMVDLSYQTSNHQSASDTLLYEVYQTILADSYFDFLTFTPSIKESGTYAVEEVLENVKKEEISADVFIAYYEFLIRDGNSSFYLSIPIYSTIIKVDGDMISDPFDGTLISKVSFEMKY